MNFTYKILNLFQKFSNKYVIILKLYVSTYVFTTQGNYVGYMFRLLNSHLQAYSLQVKSQDAVHTLGSQCVYISGILKQYVHNIL